MELNSENISVLDKFSLKGKVIVTTGSTGYVCSSFLEAVAQAGADVAMTDIDQNRSKLEDLEQHLMSAYGINAKHYICNVTDEASLVKIRSEILNDFGHIDGLICCAGINYHGSIEDYSYEDFNKMLSVNVAGTFVTNKVFGVPMTEQKHGSIINMGSIAGEIVHHKPRLMSAYSTCKAAIHHLTRAIAAEWGEYNVRCNALEPAYLEKGMSYVCGRVKSSQSPEFEKMLLDEIPMHRKSTPLGDLAGAVVYLLSDASSYTTGINLRVDGGVVLW